jgi:hypothetical protein
MVSVGGIIHCNNPPGRQGYFKAPKNVHIQDSSLRFILTRETAGSKRFSYRETH